MIDTLTDTETASTELAPDETLAVGAALSSQNRKPRPKSLLHRKRGVRPLRRRLIKSRKKTLKKATGSRRTMRRSLKM